MYAKYPCPEPVERAVKLVMSRVTATRTSSTTLGLRSGVHNCHSSGNIMMVLMDDPVSRPQGDILTKLESAQFCSDTHLMNVGGTPVQFYCSFEGPVAKKKTRSRTNNAAPSPFQAPRGKRLNDRISRLRDPSNASTRVIRSLSRGCMPRMHQAPLVFDATGRQACESPRNLSTL